ncbi:MAG: glycosyltransferase family A protein [Pirellulaceae bacterium]|nr:glycosyltransferase family A protein [Pirellulaceae bacterium]
MTDFRVTVIHQNNQGPAQSLNNGLNLWQTQYAARLDAGDFCHPTIMCRRTAFLKVGEYKACVGGD